MNRTLLGLLVLSPLAVAMYFSSTTSKPNLSPKAGTIVTKEPQSKPPVTIASSSGETRSQEVLRQYNESSARMAKSMSPKIREAIVSARMRSREPRYRELFGRWKLEPATADNILHIIKKREVEQLDALQKLGATGDPGRRFYLESHKVEAALGHEQLKLLIASEQLKELSGLEDEMAAEAYSKTMTQLSD